MRPIPIIGLLAGLWIPLAAHAQNAPVLALSGGQRVKVEAKKFDSSSLIADSIELAEPDEDLEIEGPIRNLDNRRRTFEIGEVSVQITEATKIESAERQPRLLDDLREGVRVKVKTKIFERRSVRADEVRIDEKSGDRDFEIVAPIDRIDTLRSQLSLLSFDVLITETTLHPGIDLLEGDSTDRYIRRDDDEPSRPPVRLGPFFMGGKLRFAYEEARNLDLDEEEPDTTGRFRPSAELEVSAPLSEEVFAYGRFNFTREVFLKSPEPRETAAQFNVSELFLYVGNLFHPSLALQIGRQRIRDNREWLFDERLDSIRLHAGSARWKAEFAAARAIRPTASTRDQLYLIARADYRFAGQNFVGGHVVRRNDVTAADEDPIWFGFNARGRATRDIRYWAEYGRMRGRKADDLLRGHAYDLGLSYRFRMLPLEPTLAAGHAFGSGDTNLDDGIDGNFRQTGLHDNSHRIGGLKRYRYYGALTEPELFNMKISTLDLGLRPGESWSLNFVYHTYRQATPSRRTGDIELERRPRGRNADLGRELDVIFAVRQNRRFDFYLVSGIFVPGPAYDGPRSRAFMFRPEFYLYF